MKGTPNTMDSDSSDGLEYDRESAGSPTERPDPGLDHGEEVYSQGNTNSVMGIPMQPAEMHDPGHGVAGPAMAPLDDHENMDVASEDDAMDAGDAMGPIHVQKPPPLQRKELCWLCTFCTHSLAVKISSFISNNAHRMSNQHIAEQVKDSILSFDYKHGGWFFPPCRSTYCCPPFPPSPSFPSPQVGTSLISWWSSSASW